MKRLALFFSLALSATGFAQAPKETPLDIRIAKDGWGSAGSADIKTVCLSAAGEILKHLPGREFEPISVTYSTRGPMVVYGLGDSRERRVLLNVQDSY